MTFTKKQGQYLAFIYNYAKIHGQPPAERDMQMYFRVTPPSVHQMVLTLEKSGCISRTPGASQINPSPRAQGGDPTTWLKAERTPKEEGKQNLCVKAIPSVLHFTGSFGVTLYFEEFDSAVEYYRQVLGLAAYA